MAPDYLDPNRLGIVHCHHVLHWRLQLFRAERHKQSQRHDEKYDRYVPNARHMGGELGTGLGKARLAIFPIASGGFRDASVSTCSSHLRWNRETDGRYGTFVFNGLISPACFAPPQGIHLPHEPVLEETGEVPAAQGQSRAGYDVVPTNDR